MDERISKTPTESRHVRCFTRTLKNARYLQTIAPDIFAKDPYAEGFGTGVPIEILRDLHRLPPDSPMLNRHKAVAEFVRKTKLPVPGRTARDALFSGTVYFAQITFHTSHGNLVIPSADMNMIVQYAQHAAIPISEYAAQYGLNSLSISPNLIAYTVNVAHASFTDSDLQRWVNDMAQQNHLPSNSCIFVIVPQGVSASNVDGNAGYHGLANIPYIVAGVFAQNLTLQDLPDVYAMVISHEMAEMVVDPRVDGQNPEVCDPCDLNCQNLTRIYFDASDNFLGTNQASPPSGFTFSYYICAVVRSAAASSCPAPAAACQYTPGFLLQTGTPIAQVDASTNFMFAIGDYNRDSIPDVYGLKRTNTGTNSLEVHVLNGADNYQSFLLQTGTPIAQVDAAANFVFAVGDYNRDGIPDVYALKLTNTGTNSLEVHVLNGADNYQSFLLQTGTPITQADAAANFMFAVGDYNRDGIPDLYCFKRSNTGTNSLEIHVLNGADNYQSFLLQTGTPIAQVDAANFVFAVGDYNHDGIPDVYGLKRTNSGTNSLEVHVLNGADNYQSFLLHTGTVLAQADAAANFVFAVGDYSRDGIPDVYALKLTNTGTNSLEVHILYTPSP